MKDDDAGCIAFFGTIWIIYIICTYIVEILIVLGWIVGISLAGVLIWYFRRPLFFGLVMALKFLGFLILAIPALVFWEIPKWFYKRYKKN